MCDDLVMRRRKWRRRKRTDKKSTFCRKYLQNILK
jgi:hypothetical protein